MIDRIRDFLDSAFESAPQTAKVQELKEELLQSGGSNTTISCVRAVLRRRRIKS